MARHMWPPDDPHGMNVWDAWPLCREGQLCGRGGCRSEASGVRAHALRNGVGSRCIVCGETAVASVAGSLHEWLGHDS